jgi:phytanoyl-CoA hydroxylase
MLTPQQVEQFQRDGFLKGNRILNDRQIEELRNELTRIIENHESLERKTILFRNLSRKNDTPVWQIIKMWEASDAYRALVSHPTISEEIAQLTQSNTLRIWQDQILYKPAETGGITPWHQDAPLWKCWAYPA